jgi:hypothetical protein
MAIGGLVASQVSVSSNSVVVSTTAATGGSGAITYQWYISTGGSGFSPASGSSVSGATGQTNQVLGSLIPNTNYWSKVVATDSTSATGVSAALALTTTPVQLSQNQFALSQIVGMVDLPYNYDTIACQVDASIGSGLIYQGQAVKIVANNVGGVPRVVACSAKADNCFGFVNFDVKSVSFGIGQMLEVSTAGNVIWLYATGAISQGAQVCLDTTASGAVQATGNSATVVGYAIDGAVGAGSIIRVKLSTPSFATA